VGGANVLRKEGDTISEAVVKSVMEVIKKKNLNVLASSLGGFERRSISINLLTGIVSFTVGDGKEEVLWNFND
ncbi:MAG: hypothetical protein GQ527_05240, partial [Bacteroidales bacterium]|nr:hypothetical protein [Bacteroidales bacterium]